MNILDCTIRDGSYVTNHQWSPSIISQIITELPKFGVKYIEIGNGTGLGAYRNNQSYMHDEDYIQASIGKTSEAKIGAFFIPGIGDKSDLEYFRKGGGEFIRIGVNSTEAAQASEYVRYAKSLGFFVFCNLMKTYAISRFKLIEVTEGLICAGADCIYIVDSAGGMIPTQVVNYVKALKNFYNVSIGFHGHNNLSLANANSLSAIEAGADFVDATLGGLGRGAGNSQLESLITIFQKANLIKDDVDVLKLSEFSKKIFSNLNTSIKGNSMRDVVVGLANFHDSYTTILEKIAHKYKISAEKLLLEVSRANYVNPSEELFDMIAQKIAERYDYKFYAPKFHHQKSILL